MGKKIIIALLSIIAVVLLALCILAQMGINKLIDETHFENDPGLIQVLNEFGRVVANDDFDDLTLTIYHTTPYGERERLSVNGLTDYVNENGDDVNGSTYRVDVTGAELKEHAELLKRINSDNIKTLRDSNAYGAVDTRIYYEFRSKNEILLRVALWGYPEGIWPTYNGSNTTAFINGRFEVRNVRILCEVIMPFLHEEDATYLNDFINGTMPDFMLEAAEQEDAPAATVIP